MRKLAVLALLAGCALFSTVANAAFITGNLEVGGGSNTVAFTTTVPLTGTIAFFPGSLVLPALNGTSGTFLSLVGDAVTFPGQGNPPTPENFNFPTGTTLLTADGLTFVTSAATTATLTPIGNGQESFTISGAGIFNLAGFDATPGSFDLSTQTVGGVFQNTSFSASANAVPGPVVGAGLPGLALAAFGWWAARRRRKQAAS